MTSVIPITKATGGALRTLKTLAMAEKGATVAEKIAGLVETGRYAVFNSVAKRVATMVSVAERAEDLIRSGVLLS